MQARLMPGFCFAARTATASRCHPETISRAQKQKIGSGCNFFAIADYRVVPIRRSRLKKCSKQLQNGPFSALREWKRVRNRKKVAETSGFLFLRWAEIAVTRQTSRKYAKSAAAATATVQVEGQTPIWRSESEPDGGKVPALQWSRRWRGRPGHASYTKEHFQFRGVVFCVCKTA